MIQAMVSHLEEDNERLKRQKAYTNELENKVSHLEEEDERLKRQKAYTNELENKVSHLEEENERLKRQKLQKPETGKKRPPESSLKTLASNKKAKVATLSGQNTGCEVKAGESKVSPEGDRLLHLSEGALGKVKKDHEATIFVKVDDRKLSIGTLSTDKSLQVMFDLVFREEFELLHTSKSSSVIFSGYKGIQQGEGEPKDEEEGQKIVAAAKEDGMQTSSSSLKSAHVEPILGKFKKDEGSDEEREKIAPAPKENVKAQANDKKPEHVNIESADVESILGKSKKDEDSDEDVESILGKSKKDEDIDEDDDDGSFDKWLPIQDYEVAEYYYIEVEEETPK